MFFFALTAEVEVDRRCHFAKLVLGLDFVEPSIALNDIVELKDDQVLVFGRLRDSDVGSVVFFDERVAAKPKYVGLRRTSKFALEDETVSIVLLSELGLVDKPGGEGVRPLLLYRSHITSGVACQRLECLPENENGVL